MKKDDAEKKFTQSSLKAMQIVEPNVICRDKKLFAQEAPGAYKDIDDIILHLETLKLVEVLQVFKPLLTLKFNGTCGH
jgi:RNA-splicing ligase RtcB